MAVDETASALPICILPKLWNTSVHGKSLFGRMDPVRILMSKMVQTGNIGSILVVFIK